MTRAQRLSQKRLELKERGLPVSYRKLAKRCSVAHPNLFLVLNEREGNLDFNRERVLDQVEAAFEAIEKENPELFEEGAANE